MAIFLWIIGDLPIHALIDNIYVRAIVSCVVGFSLFGLLFANFSNVRIEGE